MKHSLGLSGLLLMGILLFGTGASVNGVRQARDWQFAADMALANGRLMEAYSFYVKIAEAFPGTRHGRLAAKRARALNTRLLRPARSPASENLFSIIGEGIDFLTWP